MPNGGSDCCGTCWFNSTHEGKAGYFDTPPDAQVRCVIRDLVIEEPFWTYCPNHPHHNPEKLSIPIGPVYRDAGGYPYRREVWVESPDSEEIRLQLLRLLETMSENPVVEYPSSPQLDEAVIDQLMRFGERRAVPGLKRACNFDPLATPIGNNPFERSRAFTVAHALEALAALIGDEALPELTWGLTCGLEQARAMLDYDLQKDNLAVIRYYSVRGLSHCSPERSREWLLQAATDLNQEIATLAKELLATRKNGV
ncbi:MAG TPA: hypothetical protein VMG10_34400 [Gemmataceae bacterium]|nr:hypothetical protein [Gemmataceae bacterium]